MVTVSYREFAKLDLRAGTIVKVEVVEGADKLYRITVDLGTEKRTLVAGLRPYYEMADLQGKQVIMIANLEPKIIRGIPSQGMLLAADDGKTVALLRPDRKVENGAKIL